MFRHIVIVRWAHPVEGADLAELGAALDALRDTVPTVRALAYGPNIGKDPAAGDFVLSVEFDDRAGYSVYDTHPAHNDVRTILGKHIERHSVVQVDDDAVA